MEFHIKVPYTGFNQSEAKDINNAKNVVQSLIREGYIDSEDDAGVHIYQDEPAEVTFSGNGNKGIYRQLNGHADEGRKGGKPIPVDLKQAAWKHMQVNKKGEWYARVPVHTRSTALFHPHVGAKTKSVGYKTIKGDSPESWIEYLPSDMFTPNGHVKNSADYYFEDHPDEDWHRKTVLANDIGNGVNPQDIKITQGIGGAIGYQVQNRGSWSSTQFNEEFGSEPGPSYHDMTDERDDDFR